MQRKFFLELSPGAYLLTSGARPGSTTAAQDFGTVGIASDVIAESTSATGITADGVLLKDNAVTASGGIVAPTLKPAADSTSAVELQNSAGTAIVTLDTTNKICYIAGDVSTAPLGAELVANGAFATGDFTGWTAGANWSAATGVAVHTAGSTETITQDISVTSGVKYQLVFKTAGRSAGSITITLGAVTLDVGSGTTAITTNSTQTKSITAAATGSLALTITPTSDWDGSIDNISLKAIGTAQATLTLKDNAGSVYVQCRGKAALANSGIGVNALASNTVGSDNTAVGYNTLAANTTGTSLTALGVNALLSNTVGADATALGCNALYSNRSGASNTAIGYNSLLFNTTGSNNSAAGVNSLLSNTTGASLTAVGTNALYSNQTASSNTAIGYNVLYSNTTGAQNTALGAYAGAYHADGSTPLASPENSVYIGYEARGKDDSDANTIVIGYQATSLGANTTVIGNTSTTLTALPAGALRISEMSAPTGSANNATIYARDNGAGKTQLCCKLGDDVEIVIATQA